MYPSHASQSGALIDVVCSLSAQRVWCWGLLSSDAVQICCTSFKHGFPARVNIQVFVPLIFRIRFHISAHRCPVLIPRVSKSSDTGKSGCVIYKRRLEQPSPHPHTHNAQLLDAQLFLTNKMFTDLVKFRHQTYMVRFRKWVVVLGFSGDLRSGLQGEAPLTAPELLKKLLLGHDKVTPVWHCVSS